MPPIVAASRRLLIGLAAIGAVLLLTLPHQLQDLDVYRAGGLALLHGRNPYAVLSGPARLPFTYPPFATVLAAPLGALPRVVDGLLLFTGDVACLWAVHSWLRQRIGTTRESANSAAAQQVWALVEQPAVFVCGALLLAEPARSTAAYGQVNLLLLGLVVVDLGCATPRRTTGILTGVAAAVKLTPLVFIGWLVCTRQFMAASRATAAFVATGLVAFAIAPAASRDYWEHDLGDATRIGSAIYGSNQALSGLIARSERVTAPRGIATEAVTLVIAALGLAIATLWAGRDRELSLCLAALTGLIVSPISWSHHWVWIVPATLVLLTRRERLLRASGAVIAAVSVLGAPSWWERGGTREIHRGWLDLVLGETYVFAAFIVLLAAAWSVTRRPSGSVVEPAGQSPSRVRRTRSGSSSAALSG